MGGLDLVAFEHLVIEALTNDQPLERFADYAAYRADQAGRAFEAGVPVRENGLAYWAEMAALRG